MFPMANTGFFKRGGGSCPSYTPGLYTAEEIDTLVNVDGYIPVATTLEFEDIANGLTQTMGAGTCWEGSYENLSTAKYVQVEALDFTGYGTWATPIGLTGTGTYDGNEMGFANLTMTRSMFTAATATSTVLNLRLTSCSITKASSNTGLIFETIAGGSISNVILSSCSVSGAQDTGFIFGSYTSPIDDLTVNNIQVDNSNTFAISSSRGGVIAGQCVGTSTYSCTISNLIIGAQINSTGNIILGGVAGQAFYTTIENGTLSGGVLSARLSGGVVGYAQTNLLIQDVTVQNCSITSSNSTDGRIGAIAGYNPGTGVIIRRCKVSNVIVSAVGDKVGGVFGESFNGGIAISEIEILGCSIEVTGGGRDYAGGIGGHDRNVAVDIDNCRVDEDTTISANGSWAGGIMGRVDVSGTTVDNSYSAASVTAGSAAGGLVGVNSGTWTACYWDTTTGPATSAAGTGQTTSALQTPTTNSGIYSAWTIPPWDFGTASDYPTLTTTP
jgi:hypothetical protein